MRILRSGLTEDGFEETDAAAAAELADQWRPGQPIWFDATRDKEGTRHSRVGVAIDARDIAGLCKGLLGDDDMGGSEWQEICTAARARELREQKRLAAEAKKNRRDAARFGDAIRRVHDIVMVESDGVPPERVLDRVYQVVRSCLFPREDRKV